MLFFAQNKYKPDLTAYITASHVGKNFNGIKILGNNGAPVAGNDLKKVEQFMCDFSKSQSDSGQGAKRQVDVLNDYLNWLTEQIDSDKLKPLKIVLDAANGPIARVLSRLCAAIPCQPIKLNFGIKDKFLDHSPDPLKPESHRDVQKLVKQHNADLGCLWDGDGDRIVFFDDKAEFVHPYYITMLLVKIILKCKKNALIRSALPRKSSARLNILHDDRLKLGLQYEIAMQNSRLKTIKAGWPNFIKAIKKQKAVFGAETSAHYYFRALRENKVLRAKRAGSYFPLGHCNPDAMQNGCAVTADGILPLLLILEYLSKKNISLSQALAVFREKYFVMPEMNFYDIDFAQARQKLQKHFIKENQSFLDGISITSKNWHLNLRQSETEPELTRLNLEADSRKLLESKKEEVLNLIKVEDL